MAVRNLEISVRCLRHVRWNLSELYGKRPILPRDMFYLADFAISGDTLGIAFGDVVTCCWMPTGF